MKNQTYTRLSIDVSPELHRTLKLYVVKNHLNIKDYVLNLIKEDLSEELEDYLLGQMAMKAEKEGFTSAKKSEKLLKKLKKPSPNKKPKTSHERNIIFKAGR